MKINNSSIVLLIAIAAMAFGFIKQQPSKPDKPDVVVPEPDPKPPTPNPDPKPPTPEPKPPEPKPEPKLVTDMRTVFGTDYENAEKYSAFYAGFADILSSPSASAIQYREAAAQALDVLKANGLKGNSNLGDFLVTYLADFDKYKKDADWTNDVKSAYVQKFRELSAACYAASKPKE